MKKVVCCLISVFAIVIICVTYFNNGYYNKNKINVSTLKKEIKTIKNETTNIKNEIETKKEQLNELEQNKKNEIERLEEWKNLNQKVIDSLS